MRKDVYIKSLHFAIWLAIGTYWPFIYVYYTRIGLSATQVGLVITASALMGTLSATLWAMLNDRLGQVRLPMTLACAGAIVVCQVLSFQHSALAIMAVSGLFSVFTSAILPLLDSTTLGLLGQDREHYGSYRAWGTIGYVVSCTLMGAIIDHVDQTLIFRTYSLGVLLFAVLAQWLPGRPAVLARNRLSGLRTMMRRPDWLLFAVSIFVLWFGVMGGQGFLGIVITHLGGTQRTVGLTSTVSALTEIPFFTISYRLLRRAGPPRLLACAMLLYTVRVLLWGLMTGPYTAMWLSVLQGVSYVPFLVGMVAYTDRLAPDGLKATALGLTTSILGAANLAAGVTGGWLLDHAGIRGLYFTQSAICLLALGLFGLGWLRSRRTALKPVEERAPVRTG